MSDPTLPGYVLAIDLGTSGPKVALVATDGKLVAWEFEPVPLLLLAGNGAEQRPADWWTAICRAARRLLARHGSLVKRIRAVACTGQWSGTVAVDQLGAPLANAILWMDARGAPFVGRITDGPVKFSGYGIGKLWRWIRLTGAVPGRSGKDSLAHILFLKYKQPEIYRQAHRFLEPKDYLNLRLTGQFAASYDSITLHWVTDNRDPDRVRYNERLLAMAGLDEEKLPPLQRATEMVGTVQAEPAAQLGLSAGLPVVTCSPDLHSAAIGAGAVADFEAHLYVGTSSWLSCHVPFKRTDVFHNMASLPAPVPGRYFVANEQSSAGACVRFLRDNLLFHEDELGTHPAPDDFFDRVARVARAVPAGADGLIFTPWLCGERTPVEDHSVRGGFHNLSLGISRPHLIRAVLEGVAYNTRWLLQCVERFAGRRLDALRIVGGGANSDLWCQIYADVLDRTIQQVRDPIAVNVRGAALLASVALGHVSFDDMGRQVEIARTFAPRVANRLVYDRLFKEYLCIYHSNRKIYARLNGPG